MTRKFHKKPQAVGLAGILVSPDEDSLPRQNVLHNGKDAQTKIKALKNLTERCLQDEDSFQHCFRSVLCALQLLLGKLHDEYSSGRSFPEGLYSMLCVMEPLLEELKNKLDKKSKAPLKGDPRLETLLTLMDRAVEPLLESPDLYNYKLPFSDPSDAAEQFEKLHMERFIGRIGVHYAPSIRLQLRGLVATMAAFAQLADSSDGAPNMFLLGPLTTRYLASPDDASTKVCNLFRNGHIDKVCNLWSYCDTGMGREFLRPVLPMIRTAETFIIPSADRITSPPAYPEYTLEALLPPKLLEGLVSVPVQARFISSHRISVPLPGQESFFDMFKKKPKEGKAVAELELTPVKDPVPKSPLSQRTASGKAHVELLATVASSGSPRHTPEAAEAKETGSTKQSFESAGAKEKGSATQQTAVAAGTKPKGFFTMVMKRWTQIKSPDVSHKPRKSRDLKADEAAACEASVAVLETALAQAELVDAVPADTSVEPFDADAASSEGSPSTEDQAAESGTDSLTVASGPRESGEDSIHAGSGELKRSHSAEHVSGSGWKKMLKMEATEPKLRKGIILHFHGGGFVAMSSFSHQIYTRHWAKLTDLPIVSTDHRLAPEFKFPASLDDCYTAYRWVLAHHRLLGSSGESIVLAGDSAGGNMVAAVTLRAIADGIRIPDAVLLCYPSVLVSDKISPSRCLLLTDIMLNYGFIRLILPAYLGTEFDHIEDNPYVSPLLAPTELLRHFPRTYILGGRFDPLLDEAVSFYHKLKDLNRDVTLDIRDGVGHGFLQMCSMSPEAMEAVKDTAIWMSGIVNGNLPLTPSPNHYHTRTIVSAAHNTHVKPVMTAEDGVITIF